jgi:hypothetical protein
MTRRRLLGGAAALAAAPFPGFAQQAPAEGALAVDAAALGPQAADGLIPVRLPAPEPPSRRRLAGAQREKGPGWPELVRLVARGAAAGSFGDVYDNRDRGHSRLRTELHPWLGFTAYAPDLADRNLDYGLNDRLRFDRPTFGNSSTAIKHPLTARSLPRAAMTGRGKMDRLSALYGANHLYVYPEHRDHDPARGDLFPAAAPQLVVSQGSSGSDHAFVKAVAAILAAFQPDAKARLIEEGLIAPTVQMLLRRGMRDARDADTYLSAAAHPSALDQAAIDLPRMVAAANALAPDAIPPRVMLRVEREPLPTPGVELFGDGMGEALFDTPDSVARVAHGLLRVRRYRLSVADTVDPNGRPLRFHWRVLRGPGSAVTPLDAAGVRAEAEIAWTPPYEGPSGLLTLRAEIAVIADNGAALSAPAFFTVAFNPAERREHDAEGRVLAVEHVPPETAPIAPDPLLFPDRPWRDDFERDANGALLGWTRRRRDGGVDRFTRHGLRALSFDEHGRPLLAQATAYPLEAGPRGATVAERLVGPVRHYDYDGPDDLLGVLAAPAN